MAWGVSLRLTCLDTIRLHCRKLFLRRSAIERTRVLTESKIPARVLLILPEQVEHKFMVIARFGANSIFVKKKPADHSAFSITLPLNKESCPSSPSIVGKLSCVEISALTDSLFRERGFLTNLAAVPKANSHGSCNGMIQDSTPFIDPLSIRLIPNNYVEPIYLVRLYPLWLTSTVTTFALGTWYFAKPIAEDPAQGWSRSRTCV